MSARRGLVRLVCALLLAPAAVGAHTRSQSVSHWIVAGRDARVVLRVPLLELTRIPDGRSVHEWLGAYASARLVMRAEGAVCPVVSPVEVLQPADDRVGVAWTVRCAPGARTITSRFLSDVAPGHLHFVQVRQDGAMAERILSAQVSDWAFEASAEQSGTASFRGSFLDYLWLGLGHIATGLDHLTFLIAMLLVGCRGRDVLVIVTGFTIGHSMTLGLAAFELLQPEVPAVEALIGLSIALIACEGVVTRGTAPAWGAAWAIGLVVLAGARRLGVGAVPAVSLLGFGLFAACHFPLLERAARPERVRASVALLFGLVHGLGFGGFLLEVGLPATRVATALFGFNLGVEIGQLALVALAWPVLRVLGGGLWRDVGLSAATALGFYWFVTRAYG